MGLGVLGGGVATAKWLVGEGADLTVTDLKDKKYLEPSLEKLKNLEIKYVLGKHKKEDFLNNGVIVINPDVPADNKFVNLARENGKQIENELTLFFKYAVYKTAIGITGTRGKTTTTNWIGAILKNAGREVAVLGNDPEKPFLSEINNCTKDTIAVIETPSYQLEIMGESGLAPHVAVITNLYQDHLARHKTMENYALTKANIFKNQKRDDFLILNKNNKWTRFFIDLKPKSKVTFSSAEALPKFNQEEFIRQYGHHNLVNFLTAASACLALGISGEEILKATTLLPQIKFRQELVYRKDGLQIYNDTAATSPEATIVALERFSKRGQKLILITGGTDRELDFKKWSEVVKKFLASDNLVFLSGSATEKMKKELGWKIDEFGSLEECFQSAISKAKKEEGVTIVFSPSSKSFEKFKNEFDRGEKFNNLVKDLRQVEL